MTVSVAETVSGSVTVTVAVALTMNLSLAVTARRAGVERAHGNGKVSLKV